MSESSIQNRQKGQPHSTTLARGPHTLDTGEAFGLRLSFLRFLLAHKKDLD